MSMPMRWRVLRWCSPQTRSPKSCLLSTKVRVVSFAAPCADRGVSLSEGEVKAGDRTQTALPPLQGVRTAKLALQCSRACFPCQVAAGSTEAVSVARVFTEQLMSGAGGGGGLVPPSAGPLITLESIAQLREHNQQLAVRRGGSVPCSLMPCAASSWCWQQTLLHHSILQLSATISNVSDEAGRPVSCSVFSLMADVAAVCVRVPVAAGAAYHACPLCLRRLPQL